MAGHATKVAILASGDRESGGGGSSMARFIEGTQTGEVDAEVGLVICNNARGSVGVYDHVDRLSAQYGLDIDVLTISGITHPKGRNEKGQTDEEASAICEAIVLRGIWYTLMLGYMKKANGEFIEELGWKPEFAQEDPEHQGLYLARSGNTHPGILPETTNTHGEKASQRAIDLGLTETAHTLQVVAAEIDAGPKIAEHRVPIHSSDDASTVFDRVQVEEKKKLCRAMDTYFKAQKVYLSAS